MFKYISLGVYPYIDVDSNFKIVFKKKLHAFELDNESFYRQIIEETTPEELRMNTFAAGESFTRFNANLDVATSLPYLFNSFDKRKVISIYMDKFMDDKDGMNLFEFHKKKYNAIYVRTLSYELKWSFEFNNMIIYYTAKKVSIEFDEFLHDYWKSRPLFTKIYYDYKNNVTRFSYELLKYLYYPNIKYVGSIVRPFISFEDDISYRYDNMLFLKYIFRGFYDKECYYLKEYILMLKMLDKEELIDCFSY